MQIQHGGIQAEQNIYGDNLLPFPVWLVIYYHNLFVNNFVLNLWWNIFSVDQFSQWFSHLINWYKNSEKLQTWRRVN